VIGAITSHARNALGKAGTEFGELVGESWQEIKNELPKGVGAAARAAPMIGMVALAGWCLGPVTGIASAITQFKPMAQILKGFARDGKTKKPPKRGKSH
jgi:hypothetical protein